jgi:hypothetical protein
MTIEKYTSENDIHVFCLPAKSFPHDVSATHDELHKLLLPAEDRKFFGISHAESSGKIIYKAAAEILAVDKHEDYQLEIFKIKKGEYLSIYLKNYYLDIPSVERAFKELLKHPAIDPNGYCLEMYPNDGRDIVCMVKVID